MFALGAETEKKQDAKKTPKLDSQYLGRSRKINSRVAPTYWSHLGDTLLQRSVRHRAVMARTTELLPTLIEGFPKGFNLNKWRLYAGSYMKDQLGRGTHQTTLLCCTVLLSLQANEQDIMGGPSFQDPALQLLWQGVTSDPMDFQSWTALLSQAKVADWMFWFVFF